MKLMTILFACGLCLGPVFADGVKVRRGQTVEEFRNVKVLSDDWRGVKVQDGPAVRTFAAEDVIEVSYTISPPLLAPALEFAAAGKFEEATASLREIATSDPEKFPWAADAAYFRLAQLAESTGRIADAEQHWRDLAKKSPMGRHAPDAWRRIALEGICRRRAADVREAGSGLQSLAERAPSEGAHFAFEGKALLVRALTLEKAASAVADAEALKPVTPAQKLRARVERALALLTAKEPLNAVAELRACAMDPLTADADVAAARIALATLAYDAGKDEDAVIECAWIFAANEAPAPLRGFVADALWMAGRSARRLVDRKLDDAGRRLWFDRALSFYRRSAAILGEYPSSIAARDALAVIEGTKR